MAEVKKIPERSEVDKAYQWRLEDIYATDEAWQEDLEKTKVIVKELGEFKGKLSVSPETLYAFGMKLEALNVNLENLINYAQRKSDQDTRVAKYQAMVGQVMSVYVDAMATLSFETPEVLAFPDGTLERFYAECPKLERFHRHFYDITRHKEHTLSEKEEKLLAASGDIAQQPDNIYSMFADADLTFPDATDKDGVKHPLSQGSYISYMESPDRALRKSAFENLYHSYGAYKNTLAAIMATEVKCRQFNAQARHYPSSMHAALDGNNVPAEVYTNLIEAVHNNMDKMYRYVALRKKLLKVDELHMYDLYTPLVEDADEKITFEQAKQTVYEALAPMGESYRAILKEGFDGGWIDVFENVGKRSGAYSAGARVHPYVLLNHKENLNSQFTLAHEMGHAIHSYLSNRTQTPLNADYVIFVAEVASTCNEALLMEHLLSKTTDKKQRAYLINYFLEQFRTTLYRQTMFAEFEKIMGDKALAGETLTAELLCGEYRKLNRLYFGEDIVLDDEIDMEWMRIPHFYYNYYVFQYATGYAAAIALSRRILREGEPAVKDYLRFLSGGCSEDPIDLLKIAGVDMSTTKPVEEALALFGELIGEMEELTAE